MVQDSENDLIEQALLVQELPPKDFLLALVAVVQILQRVAVGGAQVGGILGVEGRVDVGLMPVGEAEAVLADALVGLFGLGQVHVQEVFGLVLFQHSGDAVEAALDSLAELAVAHAHHLFKIHDLHGEQSQQGYRHYNRQYPYRRSLHESIVLSVLLF